MKHTQTFNWEIPHMKHIQTFNWEISLIHMHRSFILIWNEWQTILFISNVWIFFFSFFSSLQLTRTVRSAGCIGLSSVFPSPSLHPWSCVCSQVCVTVLARVHLGLAWLGNPCTACSLVHRCKEEKGPASVLGRGGVTVETVDLLILIDQ